MIDPATATLISTGLNVVGSLFGGSKGETARDVRKQNSKATRQHPTDVRIGAEAAGFNPLTYLMANGSPPGLSPGIGGTGVAPLASAAAALANGVDLFASRTAEENEQRTRASARTQYERIQKEVRQAGGTSDTVRRTKQAVSNPSATNEGTEGPPVGDILDRDREIDRIKTADSPGYFILENDALPGKIRLPGDSEPWGIDELLTGVLIGGPQVVYHGAGKIGNMVDEAFNKRRFGKLMHEQKTHEAWRGVRRMGVGFNQQYSDDFQARRMITKGF